MNWFLLTLLSVLVASIASILQRVLMKGDKSNPYSYAIVFHFLLGFLNLGFALLYGSQFSLSNGNFFILLLASALWGICSIFLFKALQLLEASEITIISSLRVIVTILASVVFLQETFSVQNTIGAIIIIASTLLVVNLKKGFKFNKGVLYTLVMTLFAGLAIVADAVNVQHYDVLTYNTITNFLAGFIILAFTPNALKQWEHFVEPSFLVKMLPLVICSTTQGILYLMALTHGGNTAQVGTIRQASTVVIVLLAVIFLKERDKLGRKFTAAILVTLGVLLLN